MGEIGIPLHDFYYELRWWELQAIARGYGVVYGSAPNMFSQLEREHFGRGYSDESVRDDILNCELLIIDDLGVEFSTQFTVAQLHNIINTRILHSLPTIISTNIDSQSLGELYTQRIASRIFGCYKLIQFCGKDIRQIKNQ